MRELFEGLGFVAMALAMAAGPVIVLIAALRHHARLQERRYAFLLELADRNQPLPPQMLTQRAPAEADRRHGFVLLCGAIGLWLTLVALPLEYTEGHRLGELWGLALLPAMIGLGYLLSWWMASRGPRQHG
ncbi:DUF6249 domain-containing protein [Pelomonas sp. SE-A7]|uniref:DUF6249 domain-containing protein n=1 Tax=Pelomonas sp. SE-A7 TaxID=3054953 RepID=UPI00259CB53B|nr:DUF6249 domain-containing protein [Pelomonas sp. SE-A7]MDM4768482.1 DUF6249 domain-containing protein [Pelomonas sp. SE-A7]